MPTNNIAHILEGNPVDPNHQVVNADLRLWLQEVYALVAPGGVLGTVSQSGGVPTGALIERDINANGQYTRFADGTQICTGSITITNSATATGSIFTCASEVAWLYPAVFATTSLLSVFGSPRSSGAVWARGRAASGAQANFRLFSSLSSVGAYAVEVAAIGRWF
tara:strand:- start:29035 stop:29529 length:495 start_codon:yes stop_codon:yes gene_type:complete